MRSRKGAVLCPKQQRNLSASRSDFSVPLRVRNSPKRGKVKVSASMQASNNASCIDEDTYERDPSPGAYRPLS